MKFLCWLITAFFILGLLLVGVATLPFTWPIWIMFFCFFYNGPMPVARGRWRL